MRSKRKICYQRFLKLKRDGFNQYGRNIRIVEQEGKFVLVEMSLKEYQLICRGLAELVLYLVQSPNPNTQKIYPQYSDLCRNMSLQIPKRKEEEDVSSSETSGSEPA